MRHSNLTQVLRTFTHEDKSFFYNEKKNKNKIEVKQNDEITYSVANNAADRIQAYSLVYKVYIEKEFATPNESKMWYSLFDANPNTITFIAKQYDKVVGTITIVIDSQTGLPAESIYHNKIQILRDSKRAPAEIISLAIKKDIRGAQEILVNLFNLIYIAGKRIHGVTDLVITVNPRHAFFYKKKLLFSQAGEKKTYSKVGGAEAVLLTLDLENIQDILSKISQKNFKTKTIYKNFIPTEFESKTLNKIKSEIKMMTATEFKYFFKSTINDSVNNKHMDYLKNIHEKESCLL